MEMGITYYIIMIYDYITIRKWALSITQLYYDIKDDKNKIGELYLYRFYLDHYWKIHSILIGLLPQNEGNKPIFTKVNIPNITDILLSILY